MPADENTSTRELTGEEAALYDRQIRLWGLEAQRKLASSHILLAGAACSPLGQEIAKNVVLAGVARLAMCSPTGTSPSPAFLGADMSTMATSLREMNPHVNIAVLDSILPHVKEFSIVCALGMSRADEVKIAKACRKNDIAFVAGRCAGSVGWFFTDYGNCYKYQKKVRGATKGVDGEYPYVTQDEEVVFCGYEDAIAAPWGKETRRSEFGWHAASTLLEFENLHGRLPSGEEDVGPLKKLYGKLCSEKKCANSKVELIEEVGRTSQFSLPPVAAIVGGMWGRELIKFVSRKDEPINNFFFFNAGTSAGSVEHVGP